MNSQNYQKILHEIKNTVTLINSSAQLLNSKCPQLHSEPYWDNIRQEITYLKNMVLEISQAGNLDSLQKEALDVNLLIQNACRYIKNAFPDLQWNLNLCSSHPIISADKIKLNQAVLNLLKNSAETGSKNISIATCVSNSYVEITVTDSGGGIPAGMEHNIFDLFTTTKAQGTGLGLAITKQIAENHGGTLHFVNRPNEGCDFTIRLPLEAE